MRSAFFTTFLGVNHQIASYLVIMQNALAVGETKEIIEKAELTTLKLRVSIPHGTDNDCDCGNKTC